MTRVIVDETHQTHLALSAHKLKFLEASKSREAAKTPTLLDLEAEEVNYNLDTLKSLFEEKYGPAAAQVNSALDTLKGVVNGAKTAANSSTPFDFMDGALFSYGDAIFALGNAINGLLAAQPGLIASEMAISTQLVSPQIEKWSQAFLTLLQGYENDLNQPNLGSQDIAKYQGDMSIANSASSSSSTSLNGVMSMLTSGTSSKTSTYQSLIQQVSSVVTALLNAMTQNWN